MTILVPQSVSFPSGPSPVPGQKFDRTGRARQVVRRIADPGLVYNHL